MSEKENGTSEPSGADALTKTATQSSTGKTSRTLSIVDQLSRTKTKEEIQSQKKKKEQAPEQVKPDEPAAEPARGRDQTATATTSSKPRHPDDDRPSMSLAPKSTRIQERSVSPGQLPDGSHATCSGERGEGYTPPSGLGRLGGKIRGIGH